MHRLTPKNAAVDTGLIELLLRPTAYPHHVDKVEVIETHISWVLLAGDFVYKIKKPLDLGFLDFHNLERRQFYCEEEIRLNKPWAPDIYIDVVPIAITADGARIGGAPPVEFAVRMRRFDQSLLLDAQIAAGSLSVADTQGMARALADRHLAAAAVDHHSRDYTVRRAIEMIRENFDPLHGAIEEEQLTLLHDWTEQELSQLDSVLWQRFDDGFFRQCHGDLHLGNFVRLADGIATFDCIEFSDDLRNIDVCADIVFVIMDLVANQRPDLAAHLLNRYLEITGDYSGMRVFNLYFTYRCLVRAKIAVVRSLEVKHDDERREHLDEAHSYCAIALRQIKRRTPILVMLTGLSGSGKTWVSGELMAALPAIRIRSDIERKRRFELAETADSESEPGAGIYAEDVSHDLYTHLNAVAANLLAAGHNVILDASFLRTAQRTAALDTARRAQSGCVILQTVAEESVLRARILARKKQATDASEADLRILELQLQNREALTADERKRTLTRQSHDFDARQTAQRIRSMITTVA